MSVSFQILGHSPEHDQTREIPDGSTVRVTFEDYAIRRVDILFPEPAAEKPGDRLEPPLSDGWTLGADGTRLSPRQEA